MLAQEQKQTGGSNKADKQSGGLHQNQNAVQFRKKDTFFGEPEQSLLAPDKPVVQAKFQYENFDTSDTKFVAMQQVIESSRNPYFNFFNSKWGSVIIRLDDKVDKNPGDASKLVKEKGAGWAYSSIADIRKMTEIEGLGAVINIRKWYFDKYSVGKLLSMVAHEVGVHIVPYMKEIGLKMPVEAQKEMGIDFSTPPDTSKVSGHAGYTDHLRVASIGHEDYLLYRQVVNDLIQSIIDRYSGRIDDEEIQFHTRELADAYLMDIATFMGNGNRWPIPLKPGVIAKKYNDYRVAEPALVKTPKRKTAPAVIQDYGELYGKVLPVVARQHPGLTILAAIIALTLIYFLLRKLW